MTNAYREEVFIIEWCTLPQEQKDEVYRVFDHRFCNDVMIKWPSEFEPWREESYQDTLTTEQIEDYWKDQTNTNGFKGDLDTFIEEYGLKFDVWIIEQNFDLTGIKKIYIDICW